MEQKERSDVRLTRTQRDIKRICEEIKVLLIDKNRKYGDSCLNPVRVFSNADVYEQINVRLDDKLSRIVSGQTDEDEDVAIDLIGYLVLRIIAKRRRKDEAVFPSIDIE